MLRCMTLAALFVSMCALFFTVGSFWWLNARSGGLHLTEVRIFSCYVRSDRSALRVPITIYNSGARPLVVVDLRMSMASDGLSATAPTRTYRKTIKPDADDVEDFPHPYVVPGRSVVTKFVEFDADPAVMTTGKPATLGLFALIDGGGWQDVGSSEIRTDCVADPGMYITYSNEPAQWGPCQLERAAPALASVRSGIKPKN